VERPNDKAAVKICDHGPGVPEAERLLIFEPFDRLSGHAQRAGGQDVGLALVRQINEAHAGEVRCMPREGGGACFEVILPLASELIEGSAASYALS